MKIWGARLSRAWVKASRVRKLLQNKVRFGETPKPTPETGALPRLHASDISCGDRRRVG